MTRIMQTKHTERKEPLGSPFGFKGGYLSELWQSICELKGETGAVGMGVGVQSVLWSDANVFIRYGEIEGNRIMGEMTRYALSIADQFDYDTPIDLIDRILPEVYAHGQSLSAMPELRYTFALNALVTVDHAAWGLYSHERGLSFEQLIPETYRHALTSRHSELASIPAIPYGMTEAGIIEVLEDGYFLLKIKIGADPDQDGDQEKMLEWDKQRMSQIHELSQRYSTPHTISGKIAYYMDANGRYESKESLLRFLEHADRIGALEHILLFEEPFPEELEIDVSDVPVRVAADESVHDEVDAWKRIEMGYGAMALKPVAKTMSKSLKVAKLAMDQGVPCFCADLTANPLLADWNKNLAARLSPIPGLRGGAIETNGYQNYANWEQMKSWHPLPGASWIASTGGMYRLDERFYQTDGGALDLSPSYAALLV
jgi:L-alanine-DL-glutamate epimerase-like enolase superfamily enzyme